MHAGDGLPHQRGELVPDHGQPAGLVRQLSVCECSVLMQHPLLHCALSAGGTGALPLPAPRSPSATTTNYDQPLSHNQPIAFRPAATDHCSNATARMPLLGVPLALALALGGAPLTGSHFTMPLTAAHRSPQGVPLRQPARHDDGDQLDQAAARGRPAAVLRAELQGAVRLHDVPNHQGGPVRGDGGRGALEDHQLITYTPAPWSHLHQHLPSTCYVLHA